MRKELKILTKTSLSVIFILILLTQIDILKLKEVFRDVSMIYLVPVIGISFLGYFMRALGWGKILRKGGSRSFKFLLSLVSMNTVLPMKAGRAGAPALLKLFFPEIEKEDAVGGTVITTFLYALLYGAIVLIGIVIIQLPKIILLGALVASGIYMTIGILLYLLGRGGISKEPVERIIGLLPEKLKFEGGGAKESFSKLLTFENVYTYSFTWIMSFVLLQGVRVFLIFEAFGFNFPNPWLLLILPIIAYSITIIPISLGGIGLAELSAYTVYQSFGVPSSIAMSVVLVDRFIWIYLPAIAGAFILGKEG